MERCKKIVSHFRIGLIREQCQRKAVANGYCWQHHPEAVKERETKRDKRLAVTPVSFFIVRKGKAQ